MPFLPSHARQGPPAGSQQPQVFVHSRSGACVEARRAGTTVISWVESGAIVNRLAGVDGHATAAAGREPDDTAAATARQATGGRIQRVNSLWRLRGGS